MPDYANELQIAVDAVRAAAEVCQRVQQTLVTADTLEKSDKSPVTVADFAAQAVVCGMLHEHLPTDPVAAEENADDLRKDAQAEIRASVVKQVERAWHGDANEATVLAAIDHGTSSDGGASGRFWTLDPIDGTKGFLRGGQYAIALALIEDGQVVLGVMGCPNLPGAGLEAGGGTGVSPGQDARTGETPVPPSKEHEFSSVPGAGVLLTGVRGAGAKQLPLDGVAVDGQPIQVSDISDGAAARFCESVESGHSDHSTSGRIARRLGITREPLRLDSQAKYGIIARGEASIYMRLPTDPNRREKIWDHAAGAIVVEEAGGRVSDITGRPLDFSKGRQLENNTGIIATNGRLHPSVIEGIEAAEGATS